MKEPSMCHPADRLGPARGEVNEQPARADLSLLGYREESIIFF